MHGLRDAAPMGAWAQASKARNTTAKMPAKTQCGRKMPVKNRKLLMVSTLIGMRPVLNLLIATTARKTGVLGRMAVEKLH